MPSDDRSPALPGDAVGLEPMLSGASLEAAREVRREYCYCMHIQRPPCRICESDVELGELAAFCEDGADGLRNHMEARRYSK